MIAVRGVPFHNESSASDVNGAKGVLGTPGPTENLGFHRKSLPLFVGHSESNIFAETGSATALIPLDERRQVKKITLLCFC